MTKNVLRIILLPLIVCLSMPEMMPQTARGERQDNLQQQKIAFFDDKLQLTDGESAKFWPVYNDFQNRRDKITRDRNTLLQYFEANQANMPEAEAKAMITKYLAFQKDETILLETYTEKFMQILPAKKVMRIYLVELDFKKWLLENLRQNKVQNPRN